MSEKTPLVSNNILSVLFILFGAFLALPSFNTIYLIQMSRDWPVVPGVVFSSEIESRWQDAQPPKANQYLPRVWFTYEVQGKEYLVPTLRLFQNYSEKIKLSEDALKRYPVGKKIEVKYQPSDPSIAYVEKSDIPTWDCVKLGMGALFMMIGAVALEGMIFRKKDKE